MKDITNMKRIIFFSRVQIFETLNSKSNQSMIQPGEGSADSTVLKKSRDDSSGGRDWKKEMQKKSKRKMSPQQPKISPQQAWQQ